MATIAFELSMPNVGSWNGRWTGEGRFYAVVRNLGRGKQAQETAKKILERRSYHYDFGDGWSARVSVREVSGSEVARIRRQSMGFCGYEWMVASIIQNGEIRP